MKVASSRGSLVSENLNLLDVIYLLWRARITVALIVVIFVLAAVTYVSVVPETYTSRIVLVPVDRGADPAGTLSRLGGLASIAGLAIPGQSSVQEPMAVLGSRDLLREFIETNGLLPVLFSEKWDSAAAKWKDSGSKEPPDIRDAVSLFDRKVRTVVDDKKTGLVTLSIRWKDSTLVRDWAEGLVRLANSRIREGSLRQAEENVKYLSSVIATSSIPAVQQAIGRILESELQKELLARGNEEFAFRVVDPPEVPKRPVGPRKMLLGAVSLILGLAAALVFVVLRDAVVPRWRAARDR